MDIERERQIHALRLRSIMQTPPTDSVVVFGILQPDGTVSLDCPPQIPPGPIQVTIRSVFQPRQRIPDGPLDDLLLSPSLDLPRSGVVHMVQPIRLLQRFPDPFPNAEAP